jgi:hypothetical protein
MTIRALESRVAALEAEVSELRGRLASPATSGEAPWWQRIAGTFANDPAHEEAMRLGRQYRESLRPKPKSAKRRKTQNGRSRHRSH